MAHYLSPQKLSTKVSHAPGGNSSFSLSWESSPPVHKNSKLVQHQPIYQQKTFKHELLQQSRFQSMIPATRSFQQQNTLLQQQLYYYQQKNKMLRQNIFGGVDNLSMFKAKYQKEGNQIKGQSHLYNGSNYSGYYVPQQRVFHRSQEQLDLAIAEQSYRKDQEREQQNSLRWKTQQQRPTVRVNNPPGGHSSILFG